MFKFEKEEYCRGMNESSFIDEKLCKHIDSKKAYDAKRNGSLGSSEPHFSSEIIALGE